MHKLYVYDGSATPPGAIIIKNNDRSDTLWVGYLRTSTNKQEVFSAVDPSEIAYALRRVQLGIVQ
jgi:hypothetical protein